MRLRAVPMSMLAAFMFVAAVMALASGRKPQDQGRKRGHVRLTILKPAARQAGDTAPHRAQEGGPQRSLQDGLELHFMFLQILAHVGVPDIVILLVASAQKAIPWSSRGTLDHVEFYAGQKAVTRAFVRNGRNAASFEKLDDPLLNMLTARGFLAAVVLVLCLRWGGASLSAPVCSSWVWVSRSTTGRKWFAPLGESNVRCVWESNLMVARLCVLCRLMLGLGVVWVVEQPANSLMQFHPRWQELLRDVHVYRHHLYMSDFGGETAKPTWLYAPAAYLTDIDRHRLRHTSGRVEHSLEVTKVTKRPDGTTSVSGGADLKGTQAYPDGFGQAIYRMQEAHRPQREAAAYALRQHAYANSEAAARVQTLLRAGRGSVGDAWGDANLEEIFALCEA